MDLLQLAEPIPTVSPSSTLMDIARTMWARHVDVVAVIEKKRIVGILTERDLARKAAGRGFDGLSLPACDAMVAPCDVVPTTTSVAEAARLMRVRGLRHLAVVGSKGEFIGMVTLRRVLHDLTENLDLTSGRS